MSDEENNDEEIRGKKIKHVIQVSTSERERELQDKLTEAENRSYMIALKAFEKLKEEAQSLGIEPSVISALSDKPQDLQDLVDEKKQPITASPDSVGSGGKGSIPLRPQDVASERGYVPNRKPTTKDASIEEYQNYYEKKLIEDIQNLKTQGETGEDIMKKTLGILNQWETRAYQPPYLTPSGKQKPSNESRALEILRRKVMDTMMKKAYEDREPRSS